MSLFLLIGFSRAEEVLDRIVAVVGNQIILESELKTQVALYATQFGIDPAADDQR